MDVRCRGLIIEGFDLTDFRDNVQGFCRTNKLREEHAQMDLLNLLLTASPKGAKEPVDHVYGLMELMHDEHKRGITIDYSNAAKSQYWKLYAYVTQIAMRYVGLKVLHAVLTPNRPSQLPSWCLNFNLEPPGYFIHFHMEYFRAGFAKEPDLTYIEPKVRFSADLSLEATDWR
ncbi:hypothetical protein H2203_007604 [Taxawa tesnikishii (nom. ined.)]|nr:hypothetical protein H2203_007604 [Dothideales sp. JES 119]